MPCDYKKYPPNWKEIRAAILARAGNRCEGSPAYPDCRAENSQPHPVTGSTVILTIAHLDNDTTHNDPENLRAWCQRCPLTYDAAFHAQNAKQTRRKKKYRNQLILLEEITR